MRSLAQSRRPGKQRPRRCITRSQTYSGRRPHSPSTLYY